MRVGIYDVPHMRWRELVWMYVPHSSFGPNSDNFALEGA